MYQAYVAYSDEDLLKYLKDNGDLILPKKYTTLEIDGRSIKSLGSIKRINANVFIRRETLLQDLGDVEIIDGYLRIQYPSTFSPILKSLGNLKLVKGELSLNEGITDLGDLEEIGGAAKFVNAKIKSIGNLKRVGDNLTLHKSLKDNIDLTSLVIEGKLSFRERSNMFKDYEYSDIDNLDCTVDVIPFPKTYLYSWTTVVWEFRGKKKIKDFYENIFKPRFLNGSPIDTMGFDSYAFALLFDLMENYKSILPESKYDEYLYELGSLYPSTESYIKSFSLESLIKEGKYELGWKLFMKGRTYLNLFDLYEWEKRLGRDLLNEKTLDLIIPKSFVTFLGRENFSEVMKRFKILLDKNLQRKQKSWFGADKITRISFWELFFDETSKNPQFFTFKYYAELINDEHLIEDMLSLDGSINSYDIKIINDKPIYKRKGREQFAHPLRTHLIEKIILRYIKNLILEAENKYRLEIGVHKVGEGGIWKSEAELYALIKDSFPNEEIIQQASPFWLGKQRFDIYLPYRNIAIEYQGEQHYRPVDFFGGKDEFEKRLELDENKKRLCDDYDCSLIYVDEGYNRKTLIDTLSKIIDEKPLRKTPFELKKSKVPKRRNNVKRIEADVQIYDCKLEKTIKFQELKSIHPKVSPNYFIERDSLYGRYILDSNKNNSKTLKGWKNIKDSETGQIYRFNKTEFADFVGVQQNSVWAFFNGRQKKFHKKYILIN